MSSIDDTLNRWDREHVWHPFTQMAEHEPLFIERAEGSRLYDDRGRAYLDAVSSLWCNVHGHRHPRIDAAIRAQLDQLAHSTFLGATNSTTVRLARRLVEVAPPGLNHVFFSGDGSSAVEVALKMAFQYWRQCPAPRPNKTHFLCLGEAYHGDTLGSVSVGGVDRFNSVFQPLCFGVVRLPLPDGYRLPPGISSAGALAHYVDQLERALADNHERIAALVLEPLVECAAGIVTHPPGYLRAARELTRKYDVLLIADEVAVGFGRTGSLFACEQEQVAPDFLCLGKGLTGGYLPMSATMVTDEVWKAFLGTYAQSRSFFHGHTYAGNPLCAAAALASLELFQEEKTLARLPDKASRLARRLAELRDLPHVGDVRQRGLIAGVELVHDKATREPFDWSERVGHAVARAARERGVLMRPLGNVVVIMPPLSVTLEELDEIMDAIAAGVALVK